VAAAMTFLAELLQEGPVLYTEVQQAAKQADHSWPSVRRAKQALKVQTRRQPHAGVPIKKQPYEWCLPTEGTPEDDAAGF
jgi:hypothetical protein